jgi:DNA-binding transcriptional ArsR family regulator
MRGVALFVGLALTLGLGVTSAAAADLVVDEATNLDDRVQTTQETVNVLLPGPVQEASTPALATTLPGEGGALEPDADLLSAEPAVANLPATTASSVDLAPDEDHRTRSPGETSEASGSIEAAEHVPIRESGELPDYVTGDDSEASQGDETTTTHAQEQRSADGSASAAETWNEMETEEKAAAGAALGLLLLGPLTLYSRIQRDDALENDTRREVYEIVEENPGVCIQEAADQADVSYSTASYHLKRLVRMDYVTREEDGNKVLYYKNGGTFTAEERDLIPILQNEEAMRVFHHIVENPWCYRAQVADALDVSHTTVNWHLDRLQDADLVEEHREGRSCHLNVNEEALDRVTSTMEKLEETAEQPTTATSKAKAAAA